MPPDSFAVLDLGTARTTLLQIEVAGGAMRYLGHASTTTQGLRKGTVVSLPLAAEGIRRVSAALEQKTDVPVERVFLSLTGAHVRGLSSQAGVALASRSHEVTREDTRRVLDLARAVKLPEDRQMLHVVPQEFVLDRQGGIHEPLGMLASRLEARVYAITVTTAIKDNLVLAANQAGLEVQELIFAPLAVAEACLHAEERQAGVAVLDLGAGSTGFLTYARGCLTHAAAIPIGGDHVTNDIAIGLSTPAPQAERIKCDYGTVVAADASENSEIEVPSLGNREIRSVPLRRLFDCIEPRARELVRLIEAELARSSGAGSAALESPRPALSAGIVLGGGASRLPGLRDLIASSTGLPVRMASPLLLDGMPGELGEPEYAFAVGACYYAHRLLSRQPRPLTFWEKLRQRWEAFAE